MVAETPRWSTRPLVCGGETARGIMDDQTRMLAGLGGLGGLSQADVGDPDSVRKQQSLGQPQQDIGDILQQIMAITDESLDEAQAR